MKRKGLMTILAFLFAVTPLLGPAGKMNANETGHVNDTNITNPNNRINSEDHSNLIVNGSFEDVSDGGDKWTNNELPTNWDNAHAFSGEPEFTVDDQVSFAGDRSLKIHAAEASRAYVAQDVPVQVGQLYKLSLGIKTEGVTASKGARVRLTFRDETNTTVEHVYTDQFVRGDEDWVHIEQLAKAPEHAERVRVFLLFEEGEGTAWFDDVTLNECNDCNLLQNGGFEDVSDGGDEWTNNELPTNWDNAHTFNGDPEFTVDDQVSFAGERSLKIHAAETGRASVAQDVPVHTGQLYKLSLRIKTEGVTASEGARVRLTFRDETNTTVEHVYTHQSVRGDEDWTHIEEFARAPEHAKK